MPMFQRKYKRHYISPSRQQLLRELSPNKPRPIRIGGKELMLCRVDNQEVVVLQNRCPHQGKRLSDGWCEAGRIVCPYHRYSFDLKTGKGGATGIDVFETVETEEGLFVLLPHWSLF